MPQITRLRPNRQIHQDTPFECFQNYTHGDHRLLTCKPACSIECTLEVRRRCVQPRAKELRLKRIDIDLTGNDAHKEVPRSEKKGKSVNQLNAYGMDHFVIASPSRFGTFLSWWETFPLWLGTCPFIRIFSYGSEHGFSRTSELCTD